MATVSPHTGRKKMAKKLADMTPFERVSKRLKGLTNEEAEDVAVQILAQVVAKKVVIHGGTEDVFLDLMGKIAKAGDEYIQKNARMLAMGKVMEERKHLLTPNTYNL